MGEGLVVYGASTAQVSSYYLVVLVSFLFIIYRHRGEPFGLFIILIFYAGLASFAGPHIYDLYKIAVALLALYWLVATRSLPRARGYIDVILAFCLFSAAMVVTSYLNGDYLEIIGSQYSRYFVLLSLFLIFQTSSDDETFAPYVGQLIMELLFIQVLLSGCKFMIMGVTESLVGSIGSQGGAMATSLPILGFMVIWVRKAGILSRWDLALIAGLVFVAFESSKRAIWFVLPVIIFLMVFYVSRRRISYRLVLLSIVAVPLVFYLGVRLNWSLNEQHKVWGNFNLDYVIDYAETYSYGGTNTVVPGTGRLGADYLLLQKVVNGNLSERDIIGSGLRKMYATNYSGFADLGYGINVKGSSTGIFQTMVSNGLVTILPLLVLLLCMLSKTKDKRFRNVLAAFVLWEYLFYTGIVIREPSLAVLVVYLITFGGAEVLGVVFDSGNSSEDLTLEDGLP